MRTLAMEAAAPVKLYKGINRVFAPVLNQLRFVLDSYVDRDAARALLFCSKNLERMGDHTTNIAESVHYMVAGTRLSGDRPKGEDLNFLRPRSAAAKQSPLRA